LFYCSKGSDPAPELSIQDVSLVRSATDATMIFQLILNKPATDAVFVDYKLTDGTAISPGDYVSASGTVTISKNQTEATITVLIKGDPLDRRQPNLQFSINLTNPKSCTLTNTSAKGTIVTEDGTYLATDNTGYTTPLTYPGYSQVPVWILMPGIMRSATEAAAGEIMNWNLTQAVLRTHLFLTEI
jgi:hypothetical protein